MPAVEIADSIVQSGRETLEKVRDLINIILSQILTVFRPSMLSTVIGNGGQRYISAILESRLLTSNNKRLFMAIQTVYLCESSRNDNEH